MSVNNYSFLAAANTDITVFANSIIQFLDSNIDSAVVQDKAIVTSMPSWATAINAEPTQTYYSVVAAITFSYHSTDFCIVGYLYRNPSSRYTCRVRIYAKNVTQTATTSLLEYLSAETTNKTFNFLIGQNTDYFVLNYIGNDAYYSVFRITNPTNSADLDVYVSCIPGSFYYNKTFNSEDIANTRVYLVTDCGKDYVSNFSKNLYNNKIPLYNFYAFVQTLGIRGKISSILYLPNSYTTTSNTFYSILGVTYVGLGSLNGAIGSYYSSILLRCY